MTENGNLGKVYLRIERHGLSIKVDGITISLGWNGIGWIDSPTSMGKYRGQFPLKPLVPANA